MAAAFETIEIGDAIPEWSRTTTLMHWNRFAAVNDEFLPFHMDDDEGRKAGNPGGAFGMGNLRYAYLLNALQDWIGYEAEVREIECRYTDMNQKGDTLTAVGRVTDKEEVEGECIVRLTVDVLNQDGESTCPGTAIVVLAPHMGDGE